MVPILRKFAPLALLISLVCGAQVLAPVYGGTGSNTMNYAADTGSANAYAVTLSPAPSGVYAITTGSVVRFKAANANTGASTLAVNGGAATAIKKNGNSTALAPGDIAGGQMVAVVFDGTVWQMLAPGSSGASGTAGGDLSGTYPNPTVVKVNGASVPASQSCVGTNSANQIVGGTCPGGGGGGSGSTPASVSAALRGVVGSYLSGSTTESVSFPSGTTAGDLAVLYARADGTLVTPTGWAVLDVKSNSWVSSPQYRYVFTKTLTSGDIASGGVTVVSTVSGTVLQHVSLIMSTVNGSTTSGVREIDSAMTDPRTTDTPPGNPVTVLSTSANAATSDVALYIGDTQCHFCTNMDTISRGTTTLTPATSGGGDWYSALADEPSPASGSYSVTFTSQSDVAFNGGDYSAIILVEGTGISSGNYSVIAPVQTLSLAVTGTGAPTLSNGILDIPPYTGTSPIVISGYTVSCPTCPTSNQSPNLVYAGPASGSAAAPTFRSLVSADLPGVLTNPMTTAGDLIVGGTGGAPSRLAAGSTAGWPLTSNGPGVAPSYQAPAASSGWTLISTTTISSQTAVNVLSVFSSLYSEYDIEIIGLVPSASNSVTFQFGNASGPTWETSANYYYGLLLAINNGGSSAPGANTTSAITIFAALQSTSSPTRQADASLILHNPTSTRGKSLYGQVAYTNATAATAGSIMGLLLTSTSYDSFRIQCASAITSGVIKVYGR